MITVAERLDRLTPAEVEAVLTLAAAAGDTDGAYPLSEHTTLHLRHGGDEPSVQLVAWAGDQLVGYGHVDVTDPIEGPSAEIVVHPQHRRRGLGRALVTAALEAAQTHTSQQAGNNEVDQPPSPLGARQLAARQAGNNEVDQPPSPLGARQLAARQAGLRLWAHGDHPSASALALTMGFQRTRVLWQMRRSLYAELPELVPPPGVQLRPFVPGSDESAWLEVNRRAFADHPEQGRWALSDLRLRMREPWFDPDGFLLAQRSPDEPLLGFHWTKVHGTLRVAESDHQHDPIGEVYVLGVDPDAHGLGLGRSLTIAGLRYLRGRQLDQVMLYVDESNPAARALYTGLGFARWSTDVLFTR